MRASSDVKFIYKTRPVKEPFAAGEVWIEVQENQRTGRCFYTALIDTGLGAGRHVLDFMIIDELGIDEEPIDAPRLLYGDPQIFGQSSYIPAVPTVKLGAYLEPDSGRFRLGVCLESPMTPGCLRIAWAARKEELLSEKEQASQKAQSFYIANPPKSLKPGMKFTFSCKKSEGLSGTVKWKVIGDGAGEISKFGTYTAPQRQGVFEVQASLEGTDLTASVYVIIKE